MLCFCKSGESFSNCCEALLSGKTPADTCEQLMRSRFSAFASGNASYLLATSSDDLAKSLTEKELIETCNTFSFVHLDVLNHDQDTVEFIAHLLLGDQHHQIHERSHFIKQNGNWKYDTGELSDTPIIKLNRNDLCPCQSGKKFKKCHSV
jgi:SEC-C motif-containing protein